MAGYVGAQMMRTPWGDASTLRERRLSPGRGTPREEARRNQRERLFAAMVAVCGEKGYAETSVGDLVDLSGVSSRSFYEHFADKEECFLATMEEVLAVVQRQVAREMESGGGGDGIATAGRTLAELVTEQPAAARLWMVESFRVGEEAWKRMNDLLGFMTALLQATLDRIPGREGMPPQLTRGLLGGMAGVVYARLARNEAEALPEVAAELTAWLLSVPPPPRPLRSPSRRRPAAGGEAPPFAAHVPGERIVRAFAAVVAERGYARATIAEVAAVASISQNTFYTHFRSKEDALYAALDSSGAQLVAATLPAVRRTPRWPEALRVALEAVFGFLAAEPAFARLRAVEVYGVGPQAVEVRDRQGADIIALLSSLASEAPQEVAPLALETTLCAVNSLAYEWVRLEDPRRLFEIVPVATYLVLAPLLGAEAACEVACG